MSKVIPSETLILADKKAMERALIRTQEWKVLQVFLNDYRAKLHVRRISELLKMSHSTAALALKRLEKNNILKSEIMGRNKNYFLNLENVQTKDYLARSEDIKKTRLMEKYFIIKKMWAELSLDFAYSHCIVLFGSYARGQADESSDLDILLIGEENKELTDWLNEFAERHNKKVHLYYFGYDAFLKSLKEKDALATEILQNHVVLNYPQAFVGILWRHFHD